jgi:DNA-binding YbaB/EbfC family protein
MNPFDLLKGQMGNWQETLKKHQEALGKIEVTGEAGASGVGSVKVKMNGRFQVTQLLIDEDAWKEGRTFVTELTLSAFNDAVAKVFEKNQGEMSSMMGGMGLPG